MDIHFETAYLNAGGKASELEKEDGAYTSSKAQMAWEMWQAAKAVPEGFVLVPKDIISVLEELTQFSSYAEIVGGISVNRAAIREQCDIAFTLIREFEDTESLKEIEAQEQSHD